MVNKGNSVMDGSSISNVKDDTPTNEQRTDYDAQFVKKPKTNLKAIFGKAAALLSLAGTLALYSLGFTITKAYYDDYKDNKPAVTQTWDHKSPTENLPWGEAGAAALLAFGAGAAGIAAGRSRRKEMKDYYASNYEGGSSNYYNSYGYNDNWFFWYWMGQNSGGGRGWGGGGGSSSSSSDNKGLALVFVAAAAVVVVASASVVTYEALHKNFGDQGLKPKKFDPETHKFAL